MSGEQARGLHHEASGLGKIIGKGQQLVEKAGEQLGFNADEVR